MKRTPTAAQKAASEEKRARMREIAGIVSKLTDEQREAIAAKMPIVTIEGHPLSGYNHCMIASQTETPVTVVGGFNQWRKAGRSVAKGQRGLCIWVPTGSKESEPAPDATSDGSGESNSRRFILATVFDISQTVELGSETETRAIADQSILQD